MLFRGKCNSEVGPQVGVFVHPDGRPRQFEPVMGLLDTGADTSVISKDLATRLGLCAVGFECVRTAYGTAWRPVFAATVVFRALDGPDERTFECQKLIEGDLTHHRFGLVVGRSILQHGLFQTAGQEFVFWIDADIPQETW